MSSSVSDKAPARHRMLLEDVRMVPAKADLNSVENGRFAGEIGRAVQRAISLVGWSNKEAAGLMAIDPAQLSRWIAGTERPQFDRLFAIAALREPLVMTLAQMAGAVIENRISFPKAG